MMFKLISTIQNVDEFESMHEASHAKDGFIKVLQAQGFQVTDNDYDAATNTATFVLTNPGHDPERVTIQLVSE